MGKIVLKTAKRSTTVKRSVVRSAVTGAFVSSSFARRIGNTTVKSSPKASAKRA